MSIEKEAREKEVKARQKSQRLEAQKSKRDARDACKEEWKEIKTLHDQAVVAWKMGCERLKATEAWPRDLPIKPKRAPKPKPVVEDELDDDGDGESNEDQ